MKKYHQNSSNEYKILGHNQIKIYLRENGNPKGTPILFIHGYSQNNIIWHKQFNSILAKEFRLLALDLRGHGFSDKPNKKGFYTNSKNWAGDINAIITYFNIQPILVGWSYGGLIICDYLRHYGDNSLKGINFVAAGIDGIQGKPEREIKLTSFDFQAILWGLNSENFKKNNEALEKFIRLLTFKKLTLEEFYFFLGYHSIVPPYVRKYISLRFEDNDDVISSIKKPVLITTGLKDNFLPVSMVKSQFKTIPQAKFSFYPNIGHTPFWENNKRFNLELKKFAKSIV